MNPEDFGKYAAIRDVLQGAYGEKRVRVIGKLYFG
jgi:hypothetical protein